MMRFILCVLIAALSGGVASAQTFACQYVASAGLVWKNEKWRNTTFALPKPFFLKVASNNLVPASVAPIFHAGEWDVKCDSRSNETGKPVKNVEVSCVGGLGNFLYFSPTNGQGAVVFTYGSAAEHQSIRDDLQLYPFTCQKM